MPFRRLAALAASAASISLAFSTFTAPAAVAQTVDEVGGGASGVELRVAVTNTTLFDLDTSDAEYVDGYESVLAEPTVTLPRAGAAKQTRFLAGQESGGVSVGAMKVTTEGNLTGTPYAESTATLTEIVGNGLDISLLRVFCRWDALNGARATTSLVGANGSLYTPAPNTKIDLPGVGYAVLNEQFTRTLDRGEQVIYVNGIHLSLELLLPTDLGLPALDDETALDVSLVLGMASCDPLKLPNLSSLLAPLTSLG